MLLPSFARTKDFVPGLAEPEGAGERLWFAFRKGEMLVRTQGPLVPRELDVLAVRTQYVGALSGLPCWAAELAPDAAPPDGARFAVMLERRELDVALTAFPLVTFERHHQFCGLCAARTEDIPGERAKRCTACAQTFYPRVTPAVIVLVHDGPRVLLTRGKNFPAGWYALVAGFLETGETLEECVAREVCEETGVEVDKVEYQGSQPWPFPHQIMVGFRARYLRGEVVVDKRELEDARWFDRNAMPPLPPPVSIARAMIDVWLSEDVR
jgi:NAD+ diphosphatase